MKKARFFLIICVIFFKYFERNQKACCDPFNKHAVPLTKKKDLRVITLQKAKDDKEHQNIILVPGKLLCSTCRKLLNVANKVLNNEETVFHYNDEDNGEEFKTAKRIVEKDVLNEALAGLDVTPLKLQSLSTHSKKSMLRKS